MTRIEITDTLIEQLATLTEANGYTVVAETIGKEVLGNPYGVSGAVFPKMKYILVELGADNPQGTDSDEGNDGLEKRYIPFFVTAYFASQTPNEHQNETIEQIKTCIHKFHPKLRLLFQRLTGTPRLSDGKEIGQVTVAGIFDNCHFYE